ncbi:MAG TPA: beta-N-acetylhexosaminidase [Pseudonocardiaceae bacterium]|jgi:hexosaminidase|nr:beta-N-acetylhexosaminidase [Pseudonocardiaceae bacterium]
MLRRLLCLLLPFVIALVFLPDLASAATTPAAANTGVGPVRVIPEPSSVHTLPDQNYTLTPFTRIIVPAHSPDATASADYLAGILRPSTGYRLPVTSGLALPGDIRFDLTGPTSLGAEGYRLSVTPLGVSISAQASAGLFYGVQTLRQLFPPLIDSSSVHGGPWRAPGVLISDTPRFAWRGAMLDVARYFFTVSQVETYINLLSMYKINVLHLHLSDNEGWRLYINGWSRLATYGGSTNVDGGPGGYYTQADYTDIVNYAQAHHIMIVPEIDTPGHVTAAQASYADLNCDDIAPPLLAPGYSSLCISDPTTYEFLDAVVGQLAALTPGPYIDMGGDEALNTSAADYRTFVDRMQQIVAAHGKKLIGWHQIEAGDLNSDDMVQYWGLSGSAPDIALAQQAVARGNKIVMSPADRTYLDMAYNSSTIGQTWIGNPGYLSVGDAYDWDPATYVPGVGESDIAGVEAPEWTEDLGTVRLLQYMEFPRLPGYAEIGWSPQSTHNWDDYRVRLAAQAPRWDALGVNYYHAPDVPWPASTN